MTGRIIPLHGEDHDEVALLLPWFANGRLEGAERARVEAHLPHCADCQVDLTLERQLMAEVASLPVAVERGWARMQERMGPARRPGRRARLAAFLAARPRWTNRSPAPWLGLALAAQFVALAVMWTVGTPPRRTPAYHALSARAARGAAAVANIVVVFRPETTEQRLRGALEASDARFVGGPTATDAYLLRVPARERVAALATLRGRSEVELAEPVDAPPS